MEKNVEQLADDCIEGLYQCRLEAKDEKASAALHNRLADFNLWCDGVGARAGSRASLEKRFQSRPDDLAMIKGMLILLRQFLENYAQLLRERQDTSAALRNVDSALENLALLAMAIRQTGTRSRLEKADRKYDPSDHVHFRDHMEFMLRIQGSPVGLKSTCLDWRQHRLLEANLRRRNRFVQAQRHSEQLKSRHANRQEASIHQYPSEKSSNTMEVELTSQLATSSQPISPIIQFPRIQSANVLENTVSWASASAPDSKEKLDFRDARRYSSASEGPRTVITNITASTDYPHVKVPLDQQSFQCPCCCQVLIRDYAVDDSLWRKHLANDVSPYTCLADKCPSPFIFYRTAADLEHHIRHDHSQTWQCPLCEECPPTFSTDTSMELHFQICHKDVGSDEWPGLLSISLQYGLGIEACPLCGESDTVDSPELIAHVLEHMHSFSLLSLPESSEEMSDARTDNDLWFNPSHPSLILSPRASEKIKLPIQSEPLRIVDRLIPWLESEAGGTVNDVADTVNSRRNIKQEVVSGSPDFFANKLYFADQSTHASARFGTDTSQSEVSSSQSSVSKPQNLYDIADIVGIFYNMKSGISHLSSLYSDYSDEIYALLRKLSSLPIETALHKSEPPDHEELLLALNKIQVTTSEMCKAQTTLVANLPAHMPDMLEEIGGDIDNIRSLLHQPQPSSRLGDYTVGWICSRSIEYIVAQSFFDENHDPSEEITSYGGSYALGRMGKHNVVVAVLSEYSTPSAAVVARDMVRLFPSIRFTLMVGIGGGAPSQKHDIRLGDIVVSISLDGNSVLQYDFGKTTETLSSILYGFLNQPPVILRNAIARIMINNEVAGQELQADIDNVLRRHPRLQKTFSRPSSDSDRLYQSTFVHPSSHERCESVCNDPSKLVVRPERSQDADNPAIHYGKIASVNKLMRDALVRDKFAAQQDILCFFEMEATGLTNHFPCLHIRGVCSYTDSHISEQWYGYSAVAAAAYAKNLLSRIPTKGIFAESYQDVLQMCYQMLRLTTGSMNATYEWYKDQVGERLEGTCMWFLEHEGFREWLKQDSGLLRVTADPGFGKSVLAKYLIDHGLPHLATICYFFFNRQGQNTVRQALCALLHQMFSQKPPLIRHAIQQFHKEGKDFIDSTQTLWEILEDAINDPQAGPIIIVLDALDECAESELTSLMKHVERQLCSSHLGHGKLKYLLTCRPYFETLYGLQAVSNAFPNIHIPGEEGLEAISREINLFIRDRVNQLSVTMQLSPKIKSHLYKRLLGTPQQTYLWVCLIFEHLEQQGCEMTREGINSAIATLPRSIHEAYEQILDYAKEPAMARKALGIISVASRPLTLSEMNIAMHIDTSRSLKDLDLEDDEAFKLRLRSLCGLLISVYQGKVYLLHSTAREFLLFNLQPISRRSQHSIGQQAHATLANACVLYLNFLNSGNILPIGAKEGVGHSVSNHTFLDYSAKHWGAHFRDADITDDDEHLIRLALEICDPNSTSYSLWFRIYWNTTGMRATDGFTSLMLASHYGHPAIVKVLLRLGADIEAKDTEYGRTPLFWAVKFGHTTVVELLLGNGADVEPELDEYFQTPLMHASWSGYLTIVRLLLDNGADVNAKNTYDHTALVYAAMNGHEAVMKLLLDETADVNAKGIHGQTALSYASENGHEAVIKLLLLEAADVDAKDINGRTALSYASENGHEAVIKLLLSTGADVNAKDMTNQTALLHAARNGHEAVVSLLLDCGADVNTWVGVNGRTALSYAAGNGHEAIVKLLLDKSADVNAKDMTGHTALLHAYRNGHKAIVSLLLDCGAEILAKDTDLV